MPSFPFSSPPSPSRLVHYQHQTRRRECRMEGRHLQFSIHRPFPPLPRSSSLPWPFAISFPSSTSKSGSPPNKLCLSHHLSASGSSFRRPPPTLEADERSERTADHLLPSLPSAKRSLKRRGEENAELKGPLFFPSSSLQNKYEGRRKGRSERLVSRFPPSPSVKPTVVVGREGKAFFWGGEAKL